MIERGNQTVYNPTPFSFELSTVSAAQSFKTLVIRLEFSSARHVSTLLLLSANNLNSWIFSKSRIPSLALISSMARLLLTILGESVTGAFLSAALRSFASLRASARARMLSCGLLRDRLDVLGLDDL